jgi:hypothetical protein
MSYFLKEIFPGNYSFQGGKRLNFVQILLYTYVDKPHVSLEREPFAIEAAASSTLFPCENSVSFSKEYLRQP